MDPVWEKCPYCGAALRPSILSKLLGLFGSRAERTSGAEAVSAGATISVAGEPDAPGSVGEFRFEVEDIFSIAGRGLVVTGTVQGATLKQGDRLTFTGTDGAARQCTAKGIETFRKVLEAAPPGTNVGILLAGVERSEIQKGMVLVKGQA